MSLFWRIAQHFWTSGRARLSESTIKMFNFSLSLLMHLVRVCLHIIACLGFSSGLCLNWDVWKVSDYLANRTAVRLLTHAAECVRRDPVS